MQCALSGQPVAFTDILHSQSLCTDMRIRAIGSFRCPFRALKDTSTPGVKNPRLYPQAASRQKTQKKRQNGKFFCLGQACIPSDLFHGLSRSLREPGIE